MQTNRVDSSFRYYREYGYQVLKRLHDGKVFYTTTLGEKDVFTINESVIKRAISRHLNKIESYKK